MRPLGNGGAGRRRWLEHDAAHAAARLVPTSCDRRRRRTWQQALAPVGCSDGFLVSYRTLTLEDPCFWRALRKPASYKSRTLPPRRAAQRSAACATEADAPRQPRRGTFATASRNPAPRQPPPRVTDSYAAAAPRRRRASPIAPQRQPCPRPTGTRTKDSRRSPSFVETASRCGAASRD